MPGWIGGAGFVFAIAFCLLFLAGQLWFAVLTLIPCFVLVFLEVRYERGLMGRNGGS
jgi:hypothetical protein